jgi:hypothetical protein
MTAEYRGHNAQVWHALEARDLLVAICGFR